MGFSNGLNVLAFDYKLAYKQCSQSIRISDQGLP